MTETIKNKTNTQSNTNQWFDDMVANLRVDQLSMQTCVLEKQKKELYEAMIKGDVNFTHNYALKSSSAFFIKNLINSYLIELIERQRVPNRLAFDLSNSKILVWAEINNDDECTERALILSAAKANIDFAQYGVHISSTIVEERDGLRIPSQYKEITIEKN